MHSIDVYRFQSSRPGWDATHRPIKLQPSFEISILASRVGRDFEPDGCEQWELIFQSSRPGWDATDKFFPTDATRLRFQSSRPGWDATAGDRADRGLLVISILASRVGRDTEWLEEDNLMLLFQSSRPGWDATRGDSRDPRRVHEFQSSRPGWDATPGGSTHKQARRFQSSRPGWDATIATI